MRDKIETLDTLSAILPALAGSDRAEQLARLLTDEDIDTLRHLAREGMGENSLRALVIIPLLVGFKTGLQAAVFSFITGVMPPMAMLGRSLLYVHSQRVAWCCASSMVSNMYCPSHSWRTVRL